MNKEKGDYSVFLIGDTGKPNLERPDEVLELLKAKLEEKGVNSSVVFLGDNIYPKGLPPVTDEKRAISEKRITVQLDAIKAHKGKIFFISGNHDWNKGKRGGLHYVRLQQKFIEGYLQRSDIYLPSKGCPGPVEVIINENVRLIFINTQWWVQKGRKPIGNEQGCTARSEEHFFRLLEEMLNHDTRQTIVIGHHPLYSKAMHGGVFSPKQHLFPLRFVHKHLYIPLPGAGSLYPLFRKYFGAVEDISYPPYRKMRNKLLHLFRKHKNLIYVAGHDHNLQYIKKGDQHFLISGSGSKAAYVSKGRSSVFSYASKGFLELIVNAQNVEIIAWEANPFLSGGKVLFKGRMIPALSSNTFTNYYHSS
jgi:predicted phosphodiesterase